MNRIISQTFLCKNKRWWCCVESSKPTTEGPIVDVVKLFFGGNLDSPKLRNWKMLVFKSKPAQKCEKNYAFLKQTILKNCL